LRRASSKFASASLTWPGLEAVLGARACFSLTNLALASARAASFITKSAAVFGRPGQTGLSRFYSFPHRDKDPATIPGTWEPTEILRVLASTIPDPEILFAKGERADLIPSGRRLRFGSLDRCPDRESKACNGKSWKQVFANHETSLLMGHLWFNQDNPPVIHARNAVAKLKMRLS